MYYPACGVLLAAGLVLNLKDRRMLALTILVGASIFLPVPRETAEQFYAFCIVAEITVAVLAIALKPRAGCLMAHLCTLMVAAHVGGFVFDGSPPLHPYRLLLKILEACQLLTCVALSPSIANILRNHRATTP